MKIENQMADRHKLVSSKLLDVKEKNRAIYTRRVKIYYGIWWLKKELSMVHGTLQFFFRNKTFLFVKIESWNFQQLFDLGFRETLQNLSSFRPIFRQHFSRGNKSCLNELKFCEVSLNKNQRDAENYRFLSWQTKKFYS